MYFFLQKCIYSTFLQISDYVQASHEKVCSDQRFLKIVYTCACVYVYIIMCLWRPEKGTEFPGPGISSDYKSHDMDAISSVRVIGTLNH